MFIPHRLAFLNHISLPPAEADKKKIAACIKEDFHITNVATVHMIYSFDIDELIETIPTAYDTGEVINELIKESKKLGIGFFPERKYIQEENAIEIVKRGYTK